MFARRKIIPVCIVAFLISCNQKTNQESKDIALMDQVSAVADTISPSPAAIENEIDPARKCIRTAEMRFKVKDVFESTNVIEDITERHGGFVTFTNLTSSTDEIKRIAITSDSSAETTYYTVSNSITVRVPNKSLDSLLKEISKEIDYLDFRIIKADDVALQLLANSKAMTRNAEAEKRIIRAIDGKGKNLNAIVGAEETVVNKNQETDENDIANLSLTDQINFSTVELSVYQRQVSKVEFFPTEKYVDEYRPGFANRLKASLVTGWQVMEFLLLTIFKVWPLIIIALLTYFFFKKSGNKRSMLIRPGI